MLRLGRIYPGKKNMGAGPHGLVDATARPQVPLQLTELPRCRKLAVCARIGLKSESRYRSPSIGPKAMP